MPYAMYYMQAAAVGRAGFKYIIYGQVSAFMCWAVDRPDIHSEKKEMKVREV